MLFFAHAVIYENVCMLYAIRSRAPYNYIFIVIKLHCYRTMSCHHCKQMVNRNGYDKKQQHLVVLLISEDEEETKTCDKLQKANSIYLNLSFSSNDLVSLSFRSTFLLTYISFSLCMFPSLCLLSRWVVFTKLLQT